VSLFRTGYAYAGFNDRVKKAHEQISMEAEIATQVRKAVAAGRGARFKDALSMPASMFDSAAGMAAQAEAQQKAAQTNSGNKAATAAVAVPTTSRIGGASMMANTAPSSGNRIPVSSNVGGHERGASVGPVSRGLRLNRSRAASNGSALPPAHNNNASGGGVGAGVISPRAPPPAFSSRDTMAMSAGVTPVVQADLRHERADSEEMATRPSSPVVLLHTNTFHGNGGDKE
jgi:hypothetical protein